MNMLGLLVYNGMDTLPAYDLEMFFLVLLYFILEKLQYNSIGLLDGGGGQWGAVTNAWEKCS